MPGLCAVWARSVRLVVDTEHGSGLGQGQTAVRKDRAHGVLAGGGEGA